MPTEEIPKAISKFLDLKKQGGAVSVLSVFVGTILLLLRLSPEQVQRLKELWWIISIPSILVLISWMFAAYIQEMKSRTKVEEGIQGSLAMLATDFEKLFSGQMERKMYLDKRFDVLEDRLRSIYYIMEKRNGYIPGKDTQQFIQGSSEME
jgi:hypothetical protein